MRGAWIPSAVLKCVASLALALLSAPVVAQVTGDHAAEFSVRFAPGATVPLGADAEFFSFGGQALVSGAFSPRILPSLVGSLGAGYGFCTLDMGTSLSLIQGGAALAMQAPLGATLRVEAGGGGGFYYGLLNDGATQSPRSGGGLLHAGAGIYHNISPVFSLGLLAEYRNFLGLGQFLGVSLGATFRLQPGSAQPVIRPNVIAPRPLSEAAEAEILRITDPEMDEVFPVFFKYYDTHPIGSARITNVSDTPLSNITMSLFVNQYMDNPTACTVPATLEAGESAAIDLRGFFNDQVLRIEESTKVSAELSVAFEQGRDEHLRTYTQTIRLHDRNSMTWDDPEKPAAYVTTKDSTVLSLKGQISRVVQGARQSEVNPNLKTAIALHTAIALYGISYTPDPASPYRTGSRMAIDYLQFPRQTLIHRAGDCDDLSILYCAVLESFTIPTAMILVPGHIFIAVNLKMPVLEARSLFPRAEDLIFRDGETWLPLEATSISDGFITAWQAGARQWRENVAREQVVFVETAQAQRTYEPVGLPASEQGVTLPDTEQMLSAYNKELTNFVDQTIYPQVAAIQNRIGQSGRQPALVNRLAVLYARYGLYDRARAELELLLQDHPDFAPAIANLGNIALQDGELERAARYYERALDLEPDNATVLLSLARVNHQLENYGTATRAYDRVKELDPTLAGRFAYLGLRGDDAARAAEAGGAAGTLLWVEEEEE